MNNENKTAYDKCQQESVDFLSQRYHAACGDAPGLGKTRTALLAAKKVGARSGLVVTVGSPRVMRQWKEEIARQYGAQRLGWRVVSFNTTLDPRIVAAAPQVDVVIIDEAHRLKDLESKWTRAVLGRGGLASCGEYVWLLSGTFKPNYRPVEMFPALKVLHPAFAHMSFAAYCQRYCGAYFDGRGMKNNGATNVEEWNALVSDFLIAHTKRQAFPGRAAPVIVPVPIDLDARDLLAVLNEERKIISRPAPISSSKEVFSQLGDSATLRRLTGAAMVPSALSFAYEQLEREEKVAVFFQHTEVGEALFRALAAQRYSCAWFAGGMSARQQDAAIAAFKGGARVLVAQQQAIGTGVDGLQGTTDTLIFAEPDWTPGETEQRINRFDRIGATSDLVTAYVLYARGTLGEAVWSVHNRKEAVGRRAGWRE